MAAELESESESPAVGSESDWSDQAVDMVEAAVSVVRDKAVEPAQRATSAIVFGFLVAFFAVPAVILLLVGAFRLVDNYLPGDTWATWLLFGGIFLIAGTLLWSKRHPQTA